MSVGAEVIYATIDQVVEAGTRIACALTQQRVGDGSIRIVNNGHRHINRGGENVGRQSDDSAARADVDTAHIFAKLTSPLGYDRRGCNGGPAAEGVSYEGIGAAFAEKRTQSAPIGVVADCAHRPGQRDSFRVSLEVDSSGNITGTASAPQARKHDQ